VATAWQLTSTVQKGAVLHRHVRTIHRAIDPVTAAAAVRTGERVMLVSSGTADTAPTLAVGAIAVCADAKAGVPHPDYVDALAHAVDYVSSLSFGDGTAPHERGWLGFLGYDAVRDFEHLPAPSPRTGAAYELFLPRTLVRLETGRTVVIGRGRSSAEAATAARAVEQALLRGAPPPGGPGRCGPGVFSRGYDDYVAAVHRAKRYIVDGDIFQVVLSIACTASAEIDGLAAFRALTALNPSPFQFWYQGSRFAAVGASPEPCLLLSAGRALIRPLAGTRPRGTDPAADLRAEAELRGSEKEQAEHRMLVDLARNDLGRVCRPGSVRVTRLMEVERYSHVMHLTSDVTGELTAGRPLDDVVRATFPAGTMAGAPKVRAMQIIDELEPEPRGLYAGAVGWLGAEQAELYLTIRSMVLDNGRVTLRAGGGIVHDSDPAEEYRECLAKLTATARIIGMDLAAATT